MESGRGDRVNLIWLLGGMYLIYTGCEMIYGIIAGTAELKAVSGVGGLSFLLVGGLMLRREWMAYQAQRRGGGEEAENGEAECEAPEEEGGKLP